MSESTPCVGCLGDRRCWVCLGRGLLDAKEDRDVRVCGRCYGSGKCSLCQPLVIAEVGRAPGLRVPRKDTSQTSG